MNTNNISVIGLGKLGSPIVASIASRGFNVIGVDLNKDFVNALNSGKAPVQEPGLQEKITKYKKNIKATSDYNEAILNTSITHVIVPTPSDPRGGFSTKYAKASFEQIGKVLKNKKDYHLVILTSTVLPGSMDSDIIPTIEKASGKKCGRDFGVCYNPEFIALGSVIWNLLNPDLVLIGEYDKKSGDILERFYNKYCMNKPAIKRMNIVNAEITKISINTYITSKISFANLLARLCDKLPGGDVDVVSDAMGQDTRIGIKYLKGGLGYGGPCFPRDNRALNFLSKKNGIDHKLAGATDKTNFDQIKFIIKKITSTIKKSDSVAILGLSYKPNTPVIEESQSIDIVKALLKKGCKVTVYDPEAMPNTKKEIGNKVKYAKTMKECVKNKSAVCLTTQWDEFKRLEPTDIKKGATVIDCWRFIDRKKFEKTTNYIALGINK